jgi:hypothetical protein
MLLNVSLQVVFSYSVEWVHQPHLKYSDRMKLYEDSLFLPTTFEIHWLSIINSFVLVLLLTGFLSIILMRILKKDFSRYMEVDEVSTLLSEPHCQMQTIIHAPGRNH